MIEEIEKDDHALKPFFDVVLYDAEDQPLSWTKGLVQSISYPTFSFVVEDQDAGNRKGYAGWTLPDALSLSMYETRQRDLEKYLLDWAFGEKGIFDLEQGSFRAVEKESYLYRQIMFRTITYETSVKGHLEHSAIDISKAVAYALQTSIDSLAGGRLTLRVQDYITEVSKEFANNVLQENVKERENIKLTEKQQIPVLDKVIKLSETVTNQLTTRIPLGRSLLVPVVIPPPLMEVPVGMNLNVKSLASKALSMVSTKPIVSGIGKSSVITRKGLSGLTAATTGKTTTKKVLSTAEGIKALRDCVHKVDEILKKLPKATSKEKTTSTSIYRVALQNYSADTYSYESGGAVSFSLTLPLVDYQKPQMNF